jgi:hypothetical protein
MTVWTSADAKRFLATMADDRLIAVWTVAQQRTTANHTVLITTPKAKSQRHLLFAPTAATYSSTRRVSSTTRTASPRCSKTP